MAIALTTGQLEGWVAQGFFPFARIGACLMVAPVFGARFVPPRTRIMLAVAITALVAPLIPTPAIAPFSPQGFVVVSQQLLIGVALGFALQIVFDALGLAGQLLANSMGLSFAFNVDPLRGSSTPALGQLYIILATLTFLALGRPPRAASNCWSQASTRCPSARPGSASEGLWSLVLWGGQLFAGAIAVALPGVTALLIVNLAFGVVSRAAPSLNLFAVGFPVSLVVGLLVVLAGIGPMQEGFTTLLAQGFDFLRALHGGPEPWRRPAQNAQNKLHRSASRRRARKARFRAPSSCRWRRCASRPPRLSTRWAHGAPASSPTSCASLLSLRPTRSWARASSGPR